MDPTAAAFKIIGRKSALERYVAFLSLPPNDSHNVMFSELVEEPQKPFGPKILGMEPLMYVLVAYTAHLASDLTMEWLKQRAREGGIAPGELTILNLKDDRPPKKEHQPETSQQPKDDL
jgi:hypothetical protein